MQVFKPWAKQLSMLAAASVLLLAGCSEPPAAAAGQGQPAPEVAVVTLSTSTVELTTELPGRTTDFRHAEIRPQVSGILQQRLFTEGQLVSAGQLLYKIDPGSYQAALSSAQAALSSAKAVQHNARLKAERIEGLLGNNVISQQDADDAEAVLMQADAAVASAEAALLTAQINLDYTDIKAPIAGQIGRSLVTEGALLTANQAQGLATIRQLDPIYVDLTQSSNKLLKLKRQLRADKRADNVQVELLLDDGSSYAEAGSLQFSEVNVDPGTGMVTLRAVFPNNNGDLLPGMFVRARLHHGTNNQALLVPQKAVSRTPKGDATVMLVNKDNQVELRPITLGKSFGQNWLVTDGLSSGEQVIVAGLQKVRPGATVTVVSAVDGE
ncbi:membrane fusion protein, multidrug efflux system [Arsukibacterium tuosuense]|uniref:Membrane fusion protein, multidrug efflux system n=1 Tax=Arsukibacterium tuosuense TaxID=1323745 RepID=A0A285JNB0_9GAMM|nr:efflux RND transporter periplasmic adaptor subunit [Arsukibacterium tuosuense]SNY60816.1 membrane fusion protein, multidrug efflux system [Arsukibacterium tuosuense]